MRRWIGLLLLFLFPLASANELVVYSGRAKILVEPLVRAFEAETGVRVRVRYGTDAQLLLTLEEEGKRSPADVFWANSPGALVRASARGLFGPLPDTLLSRPARFVPKDGRWVPLSVRFRVLAYREGAVDPSQLPARVLDLPRAKTFAGRIGWTPRYASFVDFVTVLRHLHGEDVARTWLLGMRALRPRAYSANTPMLFDLARGELDLALTNHYYVYRLKYGGAEGEYEEEEEEEAEQVPGALVAIHHFAPGDAGNLALVTGGGVLRTARDPELAARFLAFLLSTKAQERLAQGVHEYPVVAGVRVPGYMLPLEKALRLAPRVDYAWLADLKGTLRLLREVGLY